MVTNHLIAGTFLVAAALVSPLWADNDEDNQKPAPLSTTVTAVIVYEDRALVSRSASAELPAGPSVMTLGGFPAALSEASLRASVAGERVNVVSVATRTEEKPEAVREDVRAAEQTVDKLERERLRLVEQRAALDREERKLEEFARLARTAIAERATMGEADVAGFREASALFTTRRAGLDESRRAIDIKLETLDEDLGDARAELDKLSSAGTRTLRTVSVSLNAEAATTVDLTVSYIVHDCGWSPRYEVRLVGGKLSVGYQGDVRQKTGEDWTDVSMALSTARPALGAARPDLPRLRMKTVEVAKDRPRVFGAMVGRRAVVAAEAPAVPAGEALAGEGEAAVDARSQDTGVSVLFEVPGVASVPADGRSHRVPVTSFTDEKPALGYETVPKLARTVYLRCDTANATTFPMLAGPVDIWRESGFIGTSGIEFTPPKGKLAFSLGVDENLKVRRERERRKVTKEGLLNDKKVYSFAYLIEVANYRPNAEKVRVRENYPVSDIEEASVKLLGATTDPAANDEKDGLLTWEPVIAPGEKAEIRIEYEVTLPEDFAWNP